MKCNYINKVLLAFCLVFGSGAFSQPTFEWAKNISATGIEYGIGCTALDDLGSAFVFGSFTGSSIAFGGTTFKNSGSSDGYLCKYASDGSVTWAKKLGSIGIDYIRQVKADQQGNIYVLCDFGASITIGTTVYNNTSHDAFVIKYTSAGDIIWSKKISSTGVDAGRGMDVTPQGNIAISGTFNGETINFDSVTLTNSNLPETAYSNIFVVYLDTNGTTQWCKRISGENTNGDQNVRIDALGNVYIFGNYSCYDLTFDTTTVTNVSIPQGAFFNKDMFLVKYDVNGDMKWAKSFGGAIRDEADSIALDAGGNPMISGFFDSPNVTFDTVTISRQGNYGSMFLAKINSDGTLAWAKTAAYPGNTAKGSVSDSQGNIYISGIYQGVNHFGDLVVSSPTTEQAVVYITKFDTNGNAKWVKATSPATDSNTDVGVSMNSLGDLFLCARYHNPTVTFDSTTLTNTGTGNGFLAKINHESLGNPIFNPVTISLYPNPAKTTLYLQNLPEMNMPVSIYDMAGREIMHVQLVSNTIEVGNLSQGIYLLKSGNITVRFIKE